MLEGKTSEIYVLGYLVVRSIVSRWEKTLGRRIKPIFATKLLLHATRFGVIEIEWGLSDKLAEFSRNSQSKFLEWLETIANIDQKSIELFLESMDSHSRGYSIVWKSGIPRRVDEDLSTEGLDKKIFASVQEANFNLVAGQGIEYLSQTIRDKASLIAAELKDEIMKIWDAYLHLITLLPVGKDMARLVFLGEDSRVIVCPRAYIGSNEAEEPESMSRYSPRSFKLEGGEQETMLLRRYCGELKTARVLVTHVLDLFGHSDSPTQEANSSYVCMFLGDKWQRVTVGDSPSSIGPEYSTFISLIKKRVLSSSDFEDEEKMVRSPGFLADRLLTVNPNSKFAKYVVEQFDKQVLAREVALEGAMKAFSVEDKDGFQKSISETLKDSPARIQLADYLHGTGVGGSSTAKYSAIKKSLARAIIKVNSFSGIQPFGGTT